MKVTALKYAESTWTEDKMMFGGNPNVIRHLDFVMFLLEENDRKILVDAGCDTMSGFDMQNFIGPVRALEKVGLTPADITDVIITHADHDHIDGVRHFGNSVIHIQRDEYERGKNYFTDECKINIFEDECTVFESIKAIKIGGHTKGSSIVTFENDGRHCVITGDECYLREALEKKMAPNNPRSKAFFEKYSDPKYMVYLCHDLSEQ